MVKLLRLLVDKREAGRYLGRTEFDSVEVDNEVVINSHSPIADRRICKRENYQSIRLRLEGEIVSIQIITYCIYI